MMKLPIDRVQQYVAANIGDFHQNRLDSLKKLKLQNILKRKNPYLFKAKNVLTAQDLVKGLLDAHLSSQEETVFGEFLEKLAIFICGEVHQGKKSSSEGIDLEFERDKIRYIVTIKSGPDWGNSSQIKKMIQNFEQAKRILQTSRSQINMVAVNGCCYGKDNQPDKGDYLKLCGQEFWRFISDDENLYLDIIEPLGHQAKEKNQTFLEAYSRIINLFTAEFNEDFCTDGKIDWGKLVKFNSSASVKHKK